MDILLQSHWKTAAKCAVSIKLFEYVTQCVTYSGYRERESNPCHRDSIT